MEINKDGLFPYLIYNKPFPYDDNIVLYPITMNDIVLFQSLSPAITVRKNSIFHEKKIIKMTYLDFLIYAFQNKELEQEYNIMNLSQYFIYAIHLLQLCCKDAKITIEKDTGQLSINGVAVSPQIFDDLRRIMIIQNDIDFDMDEFLNYDTEKRLLHAKNDLNKKEERVNIEDYVDSLIIAMNTTEEYVMNMTIRKFWRYIKRYQLYEEYTIAKTGECSGMVSFKEPIQYWMRSFDVDDKYQNLKTDESELRNKMG